MIILENISVAFGARDLFKNVNIRIGAKERTAFVGSNGTGKSTLMKIIAGIYQSDRGKVIISKHTTVGYLPQEGIKYSGNTLYDEVYQSAHKLNEIQNELNEIEIEIKNFENKESDDFLDILQQYSELQDSFDLLEGFKLTAKVEKILKGLGFDEDEFTRPVDEFSGGWQMRIALSKLLLQNPSALLLDEPTNHLDFDSLIWVENYLKNYNGTYIIVSHDRNFLNNLTERTIELSLGEINDYSGNYSFYLKEKNLRKELTENKYRNQQKYLKQQEKFIERFRYKATKAAAVQSRMKQLDKIDFVELEDNEETVGFNFPPATHSGRVTVDIKDLHKSYDGEKYVLQGIDLLIQRGEKIALLGANGAGKSTLSRIIAGIEKYNRGTIEIGYNVQFKFFAQNQAEELDEDKTVLEIMEGASSGDAYRNLRSILGGFLFHGDDVDKKVGVLSGGEKSRLALAKMLIEPSNFLILDEPTNHLDMRSKDVLMNAIKKYAGTVLIVSHDREFLDETATKIVEVKNHGVKIYNISASEFAKLKESEIESSASVKSEMEESTSSDVTPYMKGIEIKKRKKELTKEMAPLKKIIAKYESELEEKEKRKIEIENEMSKEDFYREGTNAVKIKVEYESILKRIEEVTMLWDKETEKLNFLFNNFEEIK